MPDRLLGIEVFVWAMRLGGLSAASRKLNISPAMSGKHLDALERRLGATLVRRTTRKLSLTEAGRHFLVDAERILAELKEAEATASAETLIVEGLLRVSAPVTFGIMHVVPLITAFSKMYPSVSIEIGLNDRYVDLVEEEWDVAVRIGQHLEGNLIARKLATVSSVVCASPSYLAKHGVPRTVQDLKHHNCMGYYLSANAGSKMSWRFGLDGSLDVHVGGNLFSNNGEALVAAAQAGQGLVYGPRFIAAPALKQGKLVEIALNEPLVAIGSVYTLTHPDRRPTQKVRVWTSFLADHFRRTDIDL